MFNKPIYGMFSAEVIDRNTNEIIYSVSGQNKIHPKWLERLSAYIGGFGGVDLNEVRPYEILGFSNKYAAESYTTGGLSSDIIGSTSLGTSGTVYYDTGNIDISYINKGSVLYIADFSPYDAPNSDGYTTYSFESFRLCTSGGTTSIGSWTADQYCPVAYYTVDPPIKIIGPQLLIVKWRMNVTAG